MQNRVVSIGVAEEREESTKVCTSNSWAGLHVGGILCSLCGGHILPVAKCRLALHLSLDCPSV